MSLFILGAGGLVLFSLFFLLRPLLRRTLDDDEPSRRALNASVYRDELAELDSDLASGNLNRADYDESRDELQKRLLEDTRREDGRAASGARTPFSAAAIALALPLAAVALYLVIGTPAALAPQAARPPENAAEITPEQVEALVARLAEHLASTPDADPQGWVMLARAYSAMGRYAEAVPAFEAAERALGADARLLTDHARALALAEGHSLLGRPAELLERALKLDPDYPEALLLGGTAAFERQDYATAMRHWQRLLGQLPDDSEDAQSLRQSIDEARRHAEKTPAEKDRSEESPVPTRP